MQVEERFVVELADGGAVGAAHVVVHDLQHRYRVGVGGLGQQQVAVGLVGIGAAGALLDADQARVHAARGVAQRAFEKQVGGGVADHVRLQRVVVEELAAGPEEQSLQLGAGAGTVQHRFDAGLGEAAAEADVDDAHGGLLLRDHFLVGELPGVVAPALQRHVADVGAAAGEHLDRAAGQRGRLQGRREELVDVVELRAIAGHDQGVRQHRRPAAGRPELADERLLHAHAIGDVEEGAAAEERAMQRRQLVAFRIDAFEQVLLHQLRVLASGLRERHEEHALGGELGPDIDLAGLGAALAQHRGRVFDGVCGGAAVGWLPRLEDREVEALQVGAPPLLLGAGGHRQPLVGGPRRAPADADPFRLAVERGKLLHGLEAKAHYPTDPSISSWMRRLSSTAYSSGSSLVKGSMKPLTIMVSASTSGMPRLIR